MLVMKEELNKLGQTEEEFLKEYDPTEYDRPSVTVDIVVFSLTETDPIRLSVLMIKRGNHPHINKWALPGGFVDMDESLEDAARRELFEETDVRDAMLLELAPFSDPKRDPRTRIITFAYYALMPMGSVKPAAGDDASDAKLFILNSSIQNNNGQSMLKLYLANENISIRALLSKKGDDMGANIDSKMRIVDGSEIAGDHALIIGRSIERLRSLPPSKVIIPMLPKSFTKTMYQQAKAAVYGRL